MHRNPMGRNHYDFKLEIQWVELKIKEKLEISTI
jgi:hypothetical protein